MNPKGSRLGSFGVIASLVVMLLVLVAGCMGDAPSATVVEDGGVSTPSVETTVTASPGSGADWGDSDSEYRDMVLVKEDLPGEWVSLMRLVRPVDTVPPEVRELGWREGYVVEFGNRSGGATMRVLEVLSVVPEGNASEVLRMTYDRPAGAEGLGLSLGEECMSHRIEENGTVTYVAAFRDGEAVVTVAVRGPVQGDGRMRELFEDVAERAADRVEE